MERISYINKNFKGDKMDNSEDRATKILQKCGFIKNFVKEINLNNEIRELDMRLQTIKTTESLYSELHSRFEKLRRYRMLINKTQERSISCSKNRILKEIIFPAKSVKIINPPMKIP